MVAIIILLLGGERGLYLVYFHRQIYHYWSGTECERAIHRGVCEYRLSRSNQGVVRAFATTLAVSGGGRDEGTCRSSGTDDSAESLTAFLLTLLLTPIPGLLFHHQRYRLT